MVVHHLGRVLHSPKLLWVAYKNFGGSLVVAGAVLNLASTFCQTKTKRKRIHVRPHSHLLLFLLVFDFGVHRPSYPSSPKYALAVRTAVATYNIRPRLTTAPVEAIDPPDRVDQSIRQMS